LTFSFPVTNFRPQICPLVTIVQHYVYSLIRNGFPISRKS